MNETITISLCLMQHCAFAYHCSGIVLPRCNCTAHNQEYLLPVPQSRTPKQWWSLEEGRMGPTVLALLDWEVLDTRGRAIHLQPNAEDLPLQRGGPPHQEHLHRVEHIRAAFIGSGMDGGVCEVCGCSLMRFILCSGFIHVNMFWSSEFFCKRINVHNF